MNAQTLRATAAALVAGDKGLLAMDESIPTCNQRFAALGIPQTEEARRAWRELIVTTPFDMTVLNDLDRFHLVMDTIDRLPQTGKKGRALKLRLQAKLIEHKQYIDKHGQDMPEIRNWKWSAQETGMKGSPHK